MPVEGPTLNISAVSPEERNAALQGLIQEYRALISALAATQAMTANRISLLIGLLSAIVVVLGLVAQGDGFGDEFFLFATALIPILLAYGLVTYERMVQLSREAAVYVIGTNRIRHFLVEAAPIIEPYLVLPIADDDEALGMSMGLGMTGHRPRFLLAYAIAQGPGIVALLNGMAAAALAVMVGYRIELRGVLTVTLGVVVLVGLVALQLWYWSRSVTDLRARVPARFPTEPSAE